MRLCLRNSESECCFFTFAIVFERPWSKMRITIGTSCAFSSQARMTLNDIKGQMSLSGAGSDRLLVNSSKTTLGVPIRTICRCSNQVHQDHMQVNFIGVLYSGL